MKTLDEVIAYFDNQTQQRHVYLTEDAEDIYNDALHYLKEYKDAYGNVIASMNYHLRKIHELEQNDPLTWDELKQMEGKPVWVEELYAKEWHGEWKVVDMLYDGEYWDEDEKEFLTTDEERYHKTEQGKTWQAYRKERE